MGLKVGNDLKLYYNTGTDATPTWVEIDIVGDVTVNLEAGDAEVDLRLTNWLLNLPSKLSGSIDLALANNIGNTAYDALRGYYFNRTIAQYASANAAIATSGTEYFKAFCHFSSFPWNQATQEMSNHDATLSLSYHEESGSLVEPAWATIP
tara:strand:+ start:1198 stop:1650 length:453 start_codon:yes stop_codon:yes gene_type:complete